jgi:hypothetical protein
MNHYRGWRVKEILTDSNGNRIGKPDEQMLAGENP